MCVIWVITVPVIYLIPEAFELFPDYAATVGPTSIFEPKFLIFLRQEAGGKYIFP